MKPAIRGLATTLAVVAVGCAVPPAPTFPPVAPVLLPPAPPPPPTRPAPESPPAVVTPAAPEAPPAPELLPYQAHTPPSEVPADAPAARFANLTPQACRAELTQRALPVERPPIATPGVAVPVRLTGPLRGVTYLAPGGKSPWGVLDCRLALVLDELAPVLAEHGVRRVRVDNFYRPYSRLPARRARSQHAYGLAVDIMSFDLETGGKLSVEHDWHATIGDVSCGPDAVLKDPTPEAIALRNLVCDVAARGFFNHVLTPSYDAAHFNHLHLDVQRGTTRLGVH